ncbi:lysophospholipase L1-like esterase [Parabacteroides sp. PFB2-10]|uniref:GDSL-type esterase/lipase family protein n=1 Tax=Parabacteroides sp. PFB2-10 TaxID=1742405 RepID=UPI0024742266|nr:GDSL-type esterase/lipase family protein [Parabacteroides sp. PFB2-10]MDH6313160.1 lysophospholipase L1-like esterase [Parabacteroides sp. PFB2-10]
MMKQKQYITNLFFLLCLSGTILCLSSFSMANIPAFLQEWIEGEETIPVLPFEVDSLAPVTIPMIDSLCIFDDPECSLDSFFRELDRLLERKDTVINIVHLGDSHIQAGYFSGRMMRRLHEVFGNAGRGWIAPFKLCKTNEPDDYFIKSVVQGWNTGRIIQQNPKAPVGLGGIGIQIVSPSINLDVVIGPVNGAGYTFNQAVLYRSEGSMPMLPVGTFRDSVRVSFSDTTIQSTILADTFHISCLTDTLLIQSTRRKQGTDTLLPASAFSNSYYGFNLMNGGSGILYHSIGVNGAMFTHYTSREYLRQLALLKPSLLIISLGTNESFGRRFNSAGFTEQVRDFVRLLKQELPHTAILLTTPAECYKRVTVNKKRTYVRNEYIEQVAKAIVQVAHEEGISCWDLYSVTGGKNSYRKWFDKKLFGSDRIHFTKEGYYEQGELLFRAFIKSYNEYINRTHVTS